MKVLLDEMYPPRLAAQLNEAGIEATTVAAIDIVPAGDGVSPSDGAAGHAGSARSPSPRMRLLLVTNPAARAIVNTCNEVS